MSNLLLMQVGAGVSSPVATTSGTTAATGPQLKFFENFQMRLGGGYRVYFPGSVSFHAINLPLSLSFNYPVVLLSRDLSSGSHTIQLGLYSKTGGTLSISNSASQSIQFSNAISWFTLVTSATQNITPGPWYLAFNILSSGTSALYIYANTAPNQLNAQPAMIMGHMTITTNNLPASVATSDLDITGSDATRQNYIIITA